MYHTTEETGICTSQDISNINRLSANIQTSLENVWEYPEPVWFVYRSPLRGHKRQPWRDDE
jgi:hypothetical protein